MFHPATEDLIVFLNTLLAVDPAAITHLVEMRTICDEDMAHHATVQVIMEEAACGGDGRKRYTVGLLGLLNGFCGVFPDGPKKGWGPITAVMDKNGMVSEFIRTAP